MTSDSVGYRGLIPRCVRMVKRFREFCRMLRTHHLRFLFLIFLDAAIAAINIRLPSSSFLPRSLLILTTIGPNFQHCCWSQACSQPYVCAYTCIRIIDCMPTTHATCDFAHCLTHVSRIYGDSDCAHHTDHAPRITRHVHMET